MTAEEWPGPRPRPRDATGRPLPPGAPDELGEGDPAAGAASAAEAVDLLRACLEERRHFAAHRVVLRLWRLLDPERAELWGAVAQLTGGAVHLERGNLRGAATLLTRSTARLASSEAHDVDVAALAEAARRMAEAVDAGGPVAPEVPAEAFTPGDGP